MKMIFPFFKHYDMLTTAGKAMGLSSYGEAVEVWRKEVRDCLRNEFNHDVFSGLPQRLGLTPADLESATSQDAKDLLATIQSETEIYLLETIYNLAEKENKTKVCLGGGCALNVLANGLLALAVEDLFIPPVCSDCGISLGSVLYYWHHVLGNPFTPTDWFDPYLGDVVQEDLFAAGLDDLNRYTCKNTEELCQLVAAYLSQDKIVGWVQGRSEVGPRALGNRSILASPCSTTMKDAINSRVKHREFWRPFAPVCLSERIREWFLTIRQHPYMLEAVQVNPDKANQIPAVVHVDDTVRPQGVTVSQNPLLHQLLSEFEKLMGVPMLLNTSFNDHGKPIVNSSDEIFNVLRHNDMDYAVIGMNIYEKKTSKALFL